MDIREIDGLWCDDITFCPYKECRRNTCPRNQMHIRDKSVPHSYFVELPPDCPYRKKQDEFYHVRKKDGEMPDREKVIKGLELCKQDAKLCFSETECPYQCEFPRCCLKLMADGLELLKEQEGKNGEWITIWREDDPDTSTQARCSICNRISERPVGGYCKWCGANMSQEWGVNG